VLHVVVTGAPFEQKLLLALLVYCCNNNFVAIGVVRVFNFLEEEGGDSLTPSSTVVEVCAAEAVWMSSLTVPGDNDAPKDCTGFFFRCY